MTDGAPPPLDFGRLFEALPEAMIILDRDLTILAATDEYERVSMTAREAMVGRYLFDVFPDNPNDVDADGSRNVRASVARVFTTGVADTMATQKYDVQRPDDGTWEVRYWRPQNTPLPGPDGKVAYVIHHVEDITASILLMQAGERQADALRSSEEALEAAQRIARLGSWEYRPQDGTFTVSVGLLRLFGLVPEGAVDSLDAFLAFVSPEDREHIRGTIERAADGDVVPEVEYRIRRADGDERIVVGRREVVREGTQVVAVRASIQDITERKAMEAERERLLAQVEELARTDPLTALPNRRAWDERLHAELARAAREGTPLVVAMIDLDHFKRYNDTHGHQHGDTLLEAAAAAWQATLRETDTLARYGGEEFVLALPGCSPQDASAAVERLRAVTPEGQTVSAGLAVWDGTESADALLGRADAALYEAKHTGRDRIVPAAEVTPPRSARP